MWEMMIKKFLQILILLVWLLLASVQQFAIFDIFNTNSLHLYLIVIGCAIPQFAILFFYYKTQMSKVFVWICFVLYLLCIEWNIFAFLITLFDGHIGLSTTAGVLNIAGCIISAVVINKKLKASEVLIKERTGCTNKRYVKKLLLHILGLLFWVILAIIQHLAVLDLFETNGWFLYLIAVICASMQLLILFSYYKTQACKVLLWMCLILYVFGFTWNFLCLFLICRIGIMTTGATLNIVGTVVSIIVIERQGKDKRDKKDRLTIKSQAPNY